MHGRENQKTSFGSWTNATSAESQCRHAIVLPAHMNMVKEREPMTHKDIEVIASYLGVLAMVIFALNYAPSTFGPPLVAFVLLVAIPVSFFAAIVSSNRG